MRKKSSVIPEVLVYVAGSVFLVWYTYVSLKDAMKPPEVTKRRMSYGTDDDGEPLYDDDMDVDATLELWREQNRLIRASM